MIKKNKKGFTLAELLIVVAVIAVLVAISIPIFTAQLHKARVATDWHTNQNYDWNSVTFLNGEKVKMTTGICAVSFSENKGYSIEYDCRQRHTECHLSLPVSTGN